MNKKKERWRGAWVYIDFLCNSKSGKTKIYQVISIYGSFLGDIKWWCSWRKYAFFPAPDTLYEQDCLRDITKFLEELKK